MKPTTFKGQNIVYGKGQPEYQELPALLLPDGEVISCWELSEEEIADVIKSKCIYIKQLTFNGQLQPILPLVNLDDGIQLKYEET